MPRKASKKSGYTQAQKLAYYKAKANRNYRGRGAYTAPKSAAVGRQMGEYAGKAFDLIPGVGGMISPLASKLAGKLGAFLGNKLGTLAGWGSYTVKNNSLIVDEGNSPAYMHSSGMTTRICHREYIGDVFSSNSPGAFELKSYMLQPGASEIFPWLSDVALNYQKYKLLGAIVEFKSGSGDALTTVNTALGEVIISTNYNCADPNFASRNQMENTQYCSSAKPSVSFVHVIECDPELQSQTSLYVSQSVVPEDGLTANEINWCNVQVATVGCQGGNVNLGSLYITYEIELIQPVEATWIRTPVGDWFDAGAPTNALPFGATRVANPDNSLGGTMDTNNYYFQPNIDQGLYMVTCYWIGAGAAAIVYPTITTTNCTQPSIFGNYTVNSFLSPGGGTSTLRGMMMFPILVTGRSASFNLSGGGTLPTSMTLGSFYINVLDGDFRDSNFRKVPKLLSAPEVCEEHPIKDEYERAMASCTDAGDSELVARLEYQLKRLKEQSKKE